MLPSSTRARTSSARPPHPLDLATSAEPATAAISAIPAVPAQNALFGRGLLYVVIWSLQLLASTFASPILTHMLGPTQFGGLSYALAIFQVISVAALLGLDQALVLQRAEDGYSHSARGLITVSILISFAVTGLAIATLPTWSALLGFHGSTTLILVVILWTAPSASVQIMLALLLAEDRLGPFAIVSITSAVGGTVLGIVFVEVFHGDAVTYAWGGVICQMIAMVFGIIATRPTFHGFRDWHLTGRAMKLGLPLAMGSLAYFVLNAGDRVVLQAFLGTAQVGRYQIAYVIGSAVILLLTYTTQAWTPLFAALRDDAMRYRLSMQSRDELYLILMPIILGITLVSPLALRILAPASFGASGLTIVVFIVALTAFPVAASGASGRLLVIQRRGKTVGVLAGVAAVVNIGANLLLVPIMGITGAAAATLVSFAILAFLQLRFLDSAHRWHGAPPRIVVGVLVCVALAAGSILLPQTSEWNVGRAAVALLCLPWFVARLRRSRGGVGSTTPESSVTA